MLHFTFRFLLPHQRENTRRDCNFTKSFFLSQSYKIPVKRKNKAKWTSKDKKPPRPYGPNGIRSISVRSTRQTTKQRQNYRYICRPILCSIFFLKAKSQTRKILVCDRDSNAFHLYLLLLGPSVPRQKAEQKKAPYPKLISYSRPCLVSAHATKAIITITTAIAAMAKIPSILIPEGS